MTLGEGSPEGSIEAGDAAALGRGERTESLTGVRFVPLGGLGEIGMNCFALEQNGEILVVDCGVTFPDDDVGVDVVHPDFSWLVERASRVVGIFITHGHEDHIGALPYLLEELDRDVPVFAPTHACALLGPRLAEFEFSRECLHEVSVGQVYPVGSFLVEPIAVAHSIIDAAALAITTNAGIVLHTGDFDFDEWQPAGHRTDEERLQALGDQGVRLLLSDSTNVDREVREASEEDVARALQRLVAQAQRRLIVALFSSNVHRLDVLFAAARQSGKKVCLLGRSLVRQVEAARAIGRLQLPSDLLIAPDRARDVPRERLLVLAGGSQAEAPSSLRRLSLGTHRDLSLEPGDEVVLSSRIIPGNERPVMRMINDLLRMGVSVRSRLTDVDLHTSGHAARSEQRRMLELVRPRGFVPVHGTLHHLEKHRALAASMGVSDTVVVENGTTVWVDREAPLRLAGRVPHGLVRVAFGGLELDVETRRKRLDLSRSGVLTVAVAVDERGRLQGSAAITSYGIPGIDEHPGALSRLARVVEQTVGERAGRPGPPLVESLRRAVRRVVQEVSGVRAVVEVNVLTVGR